MTEAAGPPGGRRVDDAIPAAHPAPLRLRTLPWFWIVPVLALLIGLGLAARALYDEGPTVTIRFKNAEGIEAGKTKIRYKSVEVGMVKSIHLAPDAKRVVVTAQISREAAKLLVKDTGFWVVRPRFAAGQLSALGTLISGDYIGLDVGRSQESAREFVGLDAPPTVMTDEPGREFVLSGAELGSLDVGAPVYFRHLAVGQITALKLNDDAAGVTLRIFVREPYVRLVTVNARFWHASGVDLSLDTTGMHLHTPSLASLVFGGVSFQVPPDETPGDPAPAEQAFALFASESLALHHADGEATPLTAYFTDSVRGLAPGAAVDFRGLTVGEVRSLTVQFDADHGTARFKVLLDVYADRFAPAPDAPKSARGGSVIERAIAHGLKAQLRSSNLLTGARYVALDFFPGPAPGFAAAPARGQIATVPGGLDDLQQTLASIARKVDQVPFQEIAADLHVALASLQHTLDDTDAAMRTFNGSIAPQLLSTLAQARESLHRASQLLAEDSPLQEDVREALRQMSRSAAALRELSDELQRHPEALMRGKPAPAEGTP